MFESPHISLRPYEKKDIKDILLYINDPEVRKFLVPGTPFPMDELAEEKWIEKQSAETEVKSFAIILKETMKYMGGCGINQLDWKNRVATVGIFLGKPFWNQGYGTEALRVLIDFIFMEMNIHKVKLNVYSFNKRGIRCYEKLGFKIEGVLREEIFREGQYHDELIMGILFAEWKELRRALTLKIV